MRVLIADKFEQSGRDGLQSLGCEISYQPDLKDDALVAAIKTEVPDVLVVGCHRGGPAGVIEAGSTARQVLHAAPCAVLTVPL